VPASGADLAQQADETKIVAMMDYLRHPAEHHPGSTMPSYATLSRDDLRHLAQYLVSLRCTDPAAS
jgi:cbb3-type cytochrome oxidase cytochrome c subunit